MEYSNLKQFYNLGTGHILGFLFPCGITNNSKEENMEKKNGLESIQDLEKKKEEERRRNLCDKMGKNMTDQMSDLIRDSVASSNVLSKVPSEDLSSITGTLLEILASKNGLDYKEMYMELPGLGDVSIMKFEPVLDYLTGFEYLFTKIFERAVGIGSYAYNWRNDRKVHYFLLTGTDLNKLEMLNNDARALELYGPNADYIEVRREELRDEAKKIFFKNEKPEDKAKRLKLDINDFLFNRFFIEGETLSDFKKRLCSFLESRDINPETMDLSLFERAFLRAHMPSDVIKDCDATDSKLRQYCLDVDLNEIKSLLKETKDKKPLGQIMDHPEPVQGADDTEGKNQEIDEVYQELVKLKENLVQDPEGETPEVNETDWKKMKFKEYTKEMYDIFEKKNSDYTANQKMGSAFDCTYDILGPLSPANRFLDKIFRYISLASGKKQMVNDESIKDTLMDLANYAILTRLKMEWDDLTRK